MRYRYAFLLLAAGTVLSSAPAAARACDPVYAPCVLGVGDEIIDPAREGAVTLVEPLPPLERSVATGRRLTVIYNGPGRLPGVVDPGLILVPFSHAPEGRVRSRYSRRPVRQARALVRTPVRKACP